VHEKNGERVIDRIDIEQISTVIFLSKEDADFVKLKCDEAFCTIHDVVQVAVESAIRAMKEKRIN
jgi:hypothetical protein